MSKFERHRKKSSDTYVYPHKHCKKCGQMIKESLNYCPKCYKELQEKKKKKKDRGEEDLDAKKIDFNTQRFCPKCGEIVEIEIKSCKFCNTSIRKLKPIGGSDDELIEIANTALSDPEPDVRVEATNTLGNSREPNVLGLLTHLLLKDPDEDVRKEAADEIGDIKHKFSIDALTKATKDKSAKVRNEATESLEKIKEHLSSN